MRERDSQRNALVSVRCRLSAASNARNSQRWTRSKGFHARVVDVRRPETCYIEHHRREHVRMQYRRILALLGKIRAARENQECRSPRT